MARQVGRSRPGSKPIQLYVRLSLRPLDQQAYHVWQREFLWYYVVTAAAVCLHFLYPIGYQSAQFFRRALHYASGSRKFLHQRAQPPWGNIYIYKVIHSTAKKPLNFFFLPFLLNSSNLILTFLHYWCFSSD